MAIMLSPDQERRVAELMLSGAYQTADEVIDQALQILHDQEEWLAENRDEIAAKIEEGLAAAKRGELFDEDEVRAHMAARKKAWLAEHRQR